MLRKYLPALTLFLLSPLLAELVSAFLSPLEFFHPVRLAITLVPYGCGAIAARELVVRHGRGIASLLLLGVAFGLFFEGIVTRVLFNPDWEGLKTIADYGRVGGFQWVLALGVVHFQAMIGIVCPVLIAEAMFPDRRRESWVSGWGRSVCLSGLIGWTWVMGRLVPFSPSTAQTWSLIAVVTALILAALVVVPRESPAMRSRRTLPPWLFGIVGGVGMTLIMIGAYAVPSWSNRPVAGYLVGGLATVVAVEFGLLLWMVNRGAWDDRHRLALVSGLLSFFLLFGLLKDLEAFNGHVLVSVLALWGLIYLQRRASRLAKTATH